MYGFKYRSDELSKSYLQWITFVWMYPVNLKAPRISGILERSMQLKVIKRSFLNADWALYWRYIDFCHYKLYKERQLMEQPLKTYSD